VESIAKVRRSGRSRQARRISRATFGRCARHSVRHGNGAREKSLSYRQEIGEGNFNFSSCRQENPLDLY
jgi:hypothetical protein